MIKSNAPKKFETELKYIVKFVNISLKFIEYKLRYFDETKTE